MPRQRWRDCSSRIRPRLMINACISMSRLVSGRDFLIGSAAGCFARQKFLTAHTSHLGFRGMQMSAPKSRSAELKVAASVFGRTLAACCQSRRRPRLESIDSRKSKSRAKTRPVFASTIGTGSSKAKLATACAVYFPIPESCRICSTRRGNFPSCRFITVFAVAWRFRARA